MILTSRCFYLYILLSPSSLEGCHMVPGWIWSSVRPRVWGVNWVSCVFFWDPFPSETQLEITTTAFAKLQGRYTGQINLTRQIHEDKLNKLKAVDELTALQEGRGRRPGRALYLSRLSANGRRVAVQEAEPSFPIEPQKGVGARNFGDPRILVEKLIKLATKTCTCSRTS